MLYNDYVPDTLPVAATALILCRTLLLVTDAWYAVFILHGEICR